MLLLLLLLQNEQTIVKSAQIEPNKHTMKRPQQRKPSIVLKISLASRITGFFCHFLRFVFRCFFSLLLDFLFLFYFLHEHIIPWPVIHFELKLRALVKFEWNNENEILLVTNRIKM